MRDPQLPPPPSSKRRKTGIEPGRGSQHLLPRLNKDNNPGGARWCEFHNRLECVRTPRSKPEGVLCHNWALRGTDHCKMHSSPVGRRKAILMGEAQITAWSAINERTGGVAPGANLDPGMAVLGMLQMSWLRVAAYGELLRKQIAKDSAERIAIAIAEGRTPPVIDEDGDAVEIDPAGLIGHKMSATTAGELYATGEEVRALVELESKERDRCVSYAEKAHKMGITERMTSMAEKWSDVVAGRVVTMLADLELTPEQEARVPMLIQMHLSAIDVSAAGEK